MDPCLGILGPKMGPMFRDFCQKPTYLGGPSPYSVSMGIPPPPGRKVPPPPIFQNPGRETCFIFLLGLKLSADHNNLS